MSLAGRVPAAVAAAADEAVTPGRPLFAGPVPGEA
jgi:hypothetical protein